MKNNEMRERPHCHSLELLVHMAMVLGLRGDEMRQLCWSGIDLMRQELMVVNSKTQTQWYILLPTFLVERQHLQDQQQQRDALTQDGLVFPDKNGMEMSTARFLQVWYTYCEEGGLPHVPFHYLRICPRHRLQERMRQKRNGKLHRDGKESEHGNI